MKRVRWETGHSSGRPRKTGSGTTAERKIGGADEAEEAEAVGEEYEELSWFSVMLLGDDECGDVEEGVWEGGGGRRCRRRRRRMAGRLEVVDDGELESCGEEEGFEEVCCMGKYGEETKENVIMFGMEKDEDLDLGCQMGCVY